MANTTPNSWLMIPIIIILLYCFYLWKQEKSTTTDNGSRKVKTAQNNQKLSQMVSNDYLSAIYN